MLQTENVQPRLQSQTLAEVPVVAADLPSSRHRPPSRADGESPGFKIECRQSGILILTVFLLIFALILDVHRVDERILRER